MFLIAERSYHSETPVYQKLPSGPRHMFIPEARVAKDYFNTGFYERHILDWAVQNFLSPEMNCLDIGAHIGWYTVDMASKAKHVYAFECSPKSFNYLCANIELNNASYKVTKYNTALGNTAGTTKYYIRDPKDGGGNGIAKFEYDNIHNVPSIDVPVQKLDEFDINNINFIKLDVEGFEKEVLEGGLEMLKRNNYPKILFESWNESREKDGMPAKQLRKDLFDFLKSLNYRVVPVYGTNDEVFLAEHN